MISFPIKTCPLSYQNEYFLHFITYSTIQDLSKDGASGGMVTTNIGERLVGVTKRADFVDLIFISREISSLINGPH